MNFYFVITFHAQVIIFNISTPRGMFCASLPLDSEVMHTLPWISQDIPGQLRRILISTVPLYPFQHQPKDSLSPSFLFGYLFLLSFCFLFQMQSNNTWLSFHQRKVGTVLPRLSSFWRDVTVYEFMWKCNFPLLRMIRPNFYDSLLGHEKIYSTKRPQWSFSRS